MRDDPLALAEVLGDALVGMIADALVEPHRLLRDHAQPAAQSSERHPGLGVHVHRAVHVRPAAQHAAMQREARTVDACGLVEIVVHVDLDQIGGSHLGPQQLVPLHEKLLILAGHAHGAMIVDDIVPAVVRHEAIDRREVDARLPFRGGNVCSRPV